MISPRFCNSPLHPTFVGHGPHIINLYILCLCVCLHSNIEAIMFFQSPTHFDYLFIHFLAGIVRPKDVLLFTILSTIFDGLIFVFELFYSVCRSTNDFKCDSRLARRWKK